MGLFVSKRIVMLYISRLVAALVLSLVFFTFIPFAAMSYSYQSDEDGVIYPSNFYNKLDRQKKNEIRAPEARKLRYRPVGNKPKQDPMDSTYEEWLDGIRDKVMVDADIDEDYEDFVREISPLIFSLGYEKLAPEVRDLFASIPPSSLSPIGDDFVPKGPIDIDRAVDGLDPFESTMQAEEDVLGQDVGLNVSIEVSPAENSKILSMAYDALKLGQMEGAAELYSQVLDNDPDNVPAMFGLATTLHRSGQYDEARELYVQILARDPNNWPALNNLMVLAGEEAPEAALKELKELELINPEFSPIPAQIGLIYLRLNKPEEAIKYLTRSIILSPDNLALRYNLAVVLDHGGHKKQAARLYKQLLDASRKGYKLPESSQRISERLAFIASSPLAIR